MKTRHQASLYSIFNYQDGHLRAFRGFSIATERKCQQNPTSQGFCVQESRIIHQNFIKARRQTTGRCCGQSIRQAAYRNFRPHFLLPATISGRPKADIHWLPKENQVSEEGVHQIQGGPGTPYLPRSPYCLQAFLQ